MMSTLKTFMPTILGSMFCLLPLTTSFAHDLHQQIPDSPPPINTIETELTQAQKDFQSAEKMFNPWYAGPLLTPSAHNIPPGHFNIQPYLFMTTTYGKYDQHRKVQNIKNLWTLNHSFIFQMGLLSRLDLTVIPQVIYNHQCRQDAFNLGDTSVEFGFCVFKEKPYIPGIRLTLTESFPTGKFQKLNPKKRGIDGTGSGAYTTTFGLNLSKVFWWWPTHPLAFRSSMNYAFSAPTHVKSLNTYGGALDTRGKVKPGNKFTWDLGFEYSFTQKWVFAFDIAYLYQNETTFSGQKGQADSVGGPSQDQLSLAPALEYNPTSHLGLLAGAWFTVAGRNTSAFASGVLTLTYFW